MMNSSASLVVVTGAGGFIAGHVILSLLGRGYRVRATTTHMIETTVTATGTEEKLTDSFSEVSLDTKTASSKVQPSSSSSSSSSGGGGATSTKSSSSSTISTSSASSRASVVGSNWLDHLWTFPGAKENLEICYADMTIPSSLESIITEGVEYVVHLASPPRDNQDADYLYKFLVTGTDILLRQCRLCSTMKKFVLLSSFQALSDQFENNREYSENDWNSVSSMTKNPYAYCKTTQESNTIRFVNSNECKFSVVSILPGAVLGPHLGKRTNLSHRVLLDYLNGVNKVIPNLYINMSDVRDVAVAVLNSVLSSRILGRFIITNPAVSHSSVLQVVHNNFTDLAVPVRKAPPLLLRAALRMRSDWKADYVRNNLDRTPVISSKKAADAGMSLRPSNQTVVDTVRYLIENGFIEPAAEETCVIA